MSEDVLIKISGERLDGFDIENVEFIMPGKYEYIDGVHKVEYEEPVEGIKGKIESTIFIKGDRLEIIKRGIINSEMVFDKEENGDISYETPFGTINMQIITKNYKLKEDDELIRAYAEYSMYSSGDLLADTNIIVDICAKTAGVQTLSI